MLKILFTEFKPVNCNSDFNIRTPISVSIKCRPHFVEKLG